MNHEEKEARELRGNEVIEFRRVLVPVSFRGPFHSHPLVEREVVGFDCLDFYSQEFKSLWECRKVFQQKRAGRKTGLSRQQS